MRDFYSDLRKDGLLCGTIKLARKKAKKRQKNQPYAAPTTRFGEGMKRKKFCPLPLGAETSDLAEQLARTEHPRKKNWNRPKGSLWDRQVFIFRNVFFKVVNEYDYPYRGKFKNYSTVSYTPTIVSYAAATKSFLYARIMEKTYRITPPKGYFFGQDHLGVYCFRNNQSEAEYRLHLNTSHIIYGKRYISESVRFHISQLKKKRQEDLAEEKIIPKIVKMLKSGDFFVTAIDSYNAGNCRAGTITWGSENGFSEGKFYKAKTIMGLRDKSNNELEKRQISGALYEAAKRTLLENQNGICFLTNWRE